MLISKDKLLELDPEQLFREHTVADLQKIHSQIQEEIEKKREELRSTVGERYRDLLKVADTIRDMKDTARDVVTRIHNVTNLTQTLQEKHLMGFKNDDGTKSQNMQSSDKISKILEIKLLTTMPERIWTAIDEGKLLQAVEVYLLGEHTHLGLQVSRATQQYPIVVGLWNTIASCRLTILNSARNRLSLLQLSIEDAADSLGSILFLEPKNYLDLLNEFLELRQQGFSQTLVSEEHPTVKDKLYAAVVFVQQTFLITCLTFLDNNVKKNTTKELLDKITSETAPPTISKFPPISPLAEKHLTQIVTDFKPRTPPVIYDVQGPVVRDRLLDWVESIQQILAAGMGNLLGLIGSLQGMVAVRKKVSSAQLPDYWAAVEEVLGQYSVYELLIDPHVAARTLSLIENAWREASTSVINSMAILDEELLKDTKEGKTQPESNIKWFLWKEPESPSVTLQYLGCTPRVASLCRTLEKELKTLMEDLAVYTADIKDKYAALKHVNDCTFKSIKLISESLRDKEALTDVSESSLIVRARMLQTLPSQCPSLQKAVEAMYIHTTNKAEDGQSWSDMVTLLNRASEQMWKIWLSHVKPEMHTIVVSKLDPDVSIASHLASRPANEVVTIAEEAEDGKTVSSQLRIPSQPSFTLQECLMQICFRLNAIAVHTLPKLVHEEIVASVIDMILNHYEKLISSEAIYPSQAWQLLLDVRFLALLFLPHSQQTRAQDLFALLESRIDPFDLNVCYPYVQANVKKCAIRMQGTFGVMVDNSEKMAVLNSLKVSSGPNQGSATEEPVVLAVSSNVPWFPLLPISSGTSRKKEDFSERHTKPRTKDTKKESVSNDFVKSAGAFFGAMTGGWS